MFLFFYVLYNFSFFFLNVMPLQLRPQQPPKLQTLSLVYQTGCASALGACRDVVGPQFAVL